MIDYLLSLAAEGETMLFVQQKPLLVSGAAQFHLDGEQKFTYPAFRPGRKPLKGAFYINTGIFIEDRLATNFSASRDNIEYVAFMVLDDIGTKSKTPPLEPTWKIETSPGNFQWGYVFDVDQQPTKAAFSAAIKAVALAGYTDLGAINAVRNVRLPGSINLKPNKSGFASVLVEFHKERIFTLDGICEALGVTPSEAGAEAPSIRVKDTGNDSVLQWLSDNGYVLQPANSAGWVGVVCPNAEEHTDGQLGARYLPTTRGFCCHHSHCQHLDSRFYLQWVCDNGGPRAEHGLRDDLSAQIMTEALSRISPTEAFPDRAAQLVEEVNAAEAARVERNDWFARFAYVMSDDSYFDLLTRQEMSRAVFNAIYRHHRCQSRHSGRRVEASTWFDEHRVDSNGRALSGITYAPGETVLVTKDRLVYGNKWVDGRPALSDTASGDVQRWLDHAELLIPDPIEREHVLDVMAYKVQHPNVKINHAILHGGDEGCGKDTLYAPFIWAVCGPHLKNRGIVDGDALHGQWGYAFESEILILNELREPEARERRALANRLKPVIAAPPDTLTVNRKGLHPYEALNRLLVIAFTNDPVPISLPSQDRRWFCTWSYAPRMAPAAADAMWRWYRSGGGYEAIAAWLHARDVSAFNPAAAPPETDFKRSMVENGRSGAEAFLVDRILSREHPFDVGAIGAPFVKALSVLQSSAPGAMRIVQPALLHALKEAGWQDMGRLHSRTHSTKKIVWAAPWLLATGASKSEIRDLIETAAPPVAANVVNLR